MVMRRAVQNGHGRNVSVIIVLRAANRSLEAHNAAGPAKNRWPMNWTGLYEQLVPLLFFLFFLEYLRGQLNVFRAENKKTFCLWR